MLKHTAAVIMILCALPMTAVAAEPAGNEDDFASLPPTPDALKPVYNKIKGKGKKRLSFIATRQYIQDCKAADPEHKPRKPRNFDWAYAAKNEIAAVKDCFEDYYVAHSAGGAPVEPEPPFVAEPLDEEAKTALKAVYNKIKDNEKERQSYAATREYLDACRADILHPPDKPKNFNWKYTVEETDIVKEALENYYVNHH